MTATQQPQTHVSGAETNVVVVEVGALLLKRQGELLTFYKAYCRNCGLDEHRCATPGCRARISPEYVRCIDCERTPGWHTDREVDTPEAIARAEIEAHTENKQRKEACDG